MYATEWQASDDRYPDPNRFLRLGQRPSGIALLLPLMVLFLIGGLFIAGYRLANISKSVKVTTLPSSELKIFGTGSKRDRPKVLLVHSYHPDYEWVASVSFGIKKALSGSNVLIETFYMDTKRNTTEEWKTEMGQKALAIVEDWKPDVVIAADDNAQAYFAKHLAGKKQPPLVFCGVNRPIETYNYPQANVTGVMEKPHLIETIEFFEHLVPNSNRFLLISDNSPTSLGVIEHAKQDPQLSKYDMSYELPTTVKQWKSTIREYGSKVDAIAVYTYHTLEESKLAENPTTPDEVLNWTINNSEAPIIGFLSFAIDAGALGGVVESGSEHGFQAGKMALEILSGTPATDIKIRVVEQGKTMVNFNGAERFNITIPSSDLINRNAVITGW